MKYVKSVKFCVIAFVATLTVAVSTAALLETFVPRTTSDTTTRVGTTSKVVLPDGTSYTVKN